MALIILGSMLCFSVLQTKPLVHELLILLFATSTTPITFMLLARAAIYRDRTAGCPGCRRARIRQPNNDRFPPFLIYRLFPRFLAPRRPAWPTLQSRFQHSREFVDQSGWRTGFEVHP